MVTGIGIVSGFGFGTRVFWDQLRKNKTAIRTSGRIRSLGFVTGKAAQVPGIEPSRISHGGDLAISLSIPAMAEAIAHAALTTPMLQSTGLIVGTSLGGNDSLARHLHDKTNSLYLVATLYEHLARFFRISGPMSIASAACAASAHAICLGYDLVQSGAVRTCIVGGVDPLAALTMAGFSGLKVVSKGGARPLDITRDGLSLGEAACYLVFEESTSVASRSIKPLAEILGYGAANDAFHPTSPHPEGVGAQLAMERALQMATIPVEKIGYINLHGTGTVINDAIELKAVSRVFGRTTTRPALSSIKGAIGHTLGTAGAIELAATILGLQSRIFPGTFGLSKPLKESEGFVVLRQATPLSEVNLALSNSFAFGGHSASIVVGRAV